METKLAEFRKKHAQKKPLINWHQIYSYLTRIFSYSSKTSFETKSKEQKEEEEEEQEESVTNWQIVLIKFLLWLTLLIITIRLEFGTIYFIISLLYLMWYNLGSRRQRENSLSAYSVFNPNFEKIQGTFSAEDYDRQLRRGGSPFFSS